MGTTQINYSDHVIAGRRYPFKVIDPLGLCMRPSLILVKAFEKLRGEIVIGNESEQGDARSIMHLLTLNAELGTTGFLRFSKTQPAAPLKQASQIIYIMEDNDEYQQRDR